MACSRFHVSSRILPLLLRPRTAAPVDSPWVLRADGAAMDALLRINEVEQPMALGQWYPMRGGALRLDDVRLWMGYQIDYQPVLPAMLFVSLLGVVALGWHFYRRLWRQTYLFREAQGRSRNGFVARI